MTDKDLQKETDTAIESEGIGENHEISISNDAHYKLLDKEKKQNEVDIDEDILNKKEKKNALQENYIRNKTLKGAGISSGVVTLAAGGLATGKAALAIGGSIVAASVATPAAIGAAVVVGGGTATAYVKANNEKIAALKEESLKEKLEGAKSRKLAAMIQMDRYKDEEKRQQYERDELSASMTTTEENLNKQKVVFEQHVEKIGYKRDSSQMIMTMIGKTGHGKSTLGNRICGDTSRKGNEGPFKVSGKKDKGGTETVISANATVPFQSMNTEMDDGDEYKEGVPNDKDAPFQNMKFSRHKPSTINSADDKDELDAIDEKEEDDKESSLLIVDNPGWGDVEETNRDDHKNLMVKYLKGCGGINSFVMVISNSERIDISIQQMLSEYEKLFGAEFWKHLMIIMTGVDDEDDLEEFEGETHVDDTQTLLKKKFEHLKSRNRDIPVIPIGKKIYQKQTPLIIEKISRDKFTCNALKGPYELLQEEYEALKKKLATVDDKLRELRENIRSEEEKIEEVQNEIDELESDLMSKK